MSLDIVLEAAGSEPTFRMAREYARPGVSVTMGRASIGMPEQRFKRVGVESGKRRMYQEALNHSPCHTSQENKIIELSEKGRCRGMRQEMLADIEYGCRRKETKREEFLEIMDEMIPKDEWVCVIEPDYPKGMTLPSADGHRENAADTSCMV